MQFRNVQKISCLDSKSLPSVRRGVPRWRLTPQAPWREEFRTLKWSSVSSQATWTTRSPSARVSSQTHKPECCLASHLYESHLLEIESGFELKFCTHRKPKEQIARKGHFSHLFCIQFLCFITWYSLEVQSIFENRIRYGYGYPKKLRYLPYLQAVT